MEHYRKKEIQVTGNTILTCVGAGRSADVTQAERQLDFTIGYTPASPMGLLGSAPGQV